MKKCFTGLLLICLSIPNLAYACSSNSLILGGWSYHLNRDTDYNEVHQGVGFSCDHWSVMRFKNSYHRDSVGIGYETDSLWRNRYLDISLYVGAWSGYYDKSSAVIGGVIPVGGIRLARQFLQMRVVLTSTVSVNYFHIEWMFE